MLGFFSVVRRRKRGPVTKLARAKYLKHKEWARALVSARLAHFAPRMEVAPKRIAIRDQRTRWGSCSKAGGLNFNYRLVLLPPELADYVIVHELAHLRHFDHGAEFWALVGRFMPDWKERRELLHRHGRDLY